MTSDDTYANRNLSFRSAIGSIEAGRKLIPPTSTTVETQAKALNIPYTVEDIPESHGARLHWIGEKYAKKVFLYFHGGGYALGPLDGHIIFPYKSLEKVESDKEVILAILEYSLSDAAQFPMQMKQAIECLRLILSKEYYPKNIIIGGDSAGGNLGLALLSNTLHPYPGTQPLVLNEPLRGLLLISPWVSSDTNTQSYKDNAEIDIVTIPLLEEMGHAFVQPGDRNAWSEPYLADASWWKKAPVRNVLMTCGEKELFKDHILKAGKDLTSAGVNSRTVVCDNQVHVECIIDAQTGLEPRSMSEEIWKWLGDVI